MELRSITISTFLFRHHYFQRHLRGCAIGACSNYSRLSGAAAAGKGCYLCSRSAGSGSACRRAGKGRRRSCLARAVVVTPVPENPRYGYAIVNNERVIIEPSARKVIHVIN
jgi:L-aminopeptidase/D-esterase-like protein